MGKQIAHCVGGLALGRVRRRTERRGGDFDLAADLAGERPERARRLLSPGVDRRDQIVAAPRQQGNEARDPLLEALRGLISGAGNRERNLLAARGEAGDEIGPLAFEQLAQVFDALKHRLGEIGLAGRQRRINISDRCRNIALIGLRLGRQSSVQSLGPAGKRIVDGLAMRGYEIVERPCVFRQGSREVGAARIDAPRDGLQGYDDLALEAVGSAAQYTRHLVELAAEGRVDAPGEFRQRDRERVRARLQSLRDFRGFCVDTLGDIAAALAEDARRL